MTRPCDVTKSNTCCRYVSPSCVYEGGSACAILVSIDCHSRGEASPSHWHPKSASSLGMPSCWSSVWHPDEVFWIGSVWNDFDSFSVLCCNLLSSCLKVSISSWVSLTYWNRFLCLKSISSFYFLTISIFGLQARNVELRSSFYSMWAIESVLSPGLYVRSKCSIALLESAVKLLAS